MSFINSKVSKVLELIFVAIFTFCDFLSFYIYKNDIWEGAWAHPSPAYASGSWWLGQRRLRDSGGKQRRLGRAVSWAALTWYFPNLGTTPWGQFKNYLKVFREAVGEAAG